MTIFEALVLRSEYEAIVSGFKIPAERKSGTLDNLQWFLEQGFRKNRFRPNFERAQEIARELLERADK